MSRLPALVAMVLWSVVHSPVALYSAAQPTEAVGHAIVDSGAAATSSSTPKSLNESGKNIFRYPEHFIL